MRVYRLDQRVHAFRRRELRYAVAEIENMAGIAGAEAVEHLLRLGSDDFRPSALYSADYQRRFRGRDGL